MSASRYEALIEAFQEARRPALARAISVVENQRPGFQALMDAVLVRGVRARRVGVTGPPGAGKSTLVAGLAQRYRDTGAEVGIVAVDPTSPYSGGALLGDRIRMNDLALDAGIFIRSMATRGSLGGLATTTKEIVDLLDAFGLPRLLVETVGVGQTELDVTATADTVVVVLVPESGDAIQAMKAGLMEIADVFVVNKADRPGADRLARDLRMALHLRAGQSMKDVPAHHGVDLSRVARGGTATAAEGEEAGTTESAAREGADTEATPAWTIPVVKMVAQTGEGLDELEETLEAHAAYLQDTGELERRRRRRARVRVQDVVDRDLGRRAREVLASLPDLEQRLGDVTAGRATPYELARAVLAEMGQAGGLLR